MKERKIDVHPATDDTGEWFWCVFEWGDGPVLDEHNNVVSEGGGWFNAGCGYMPTPETAFQTALNRFHELSKQEDGNTEKPTQVAAFHHDEPIPLEELASKLNMKPEDLRKRLDLYKEKP